MKVKRKCEVCNQEFKAMTDKQWRHAKYEHDLMSVRHKKYLNLLPAV